MPDPPPILHHDDRLIVLDKPTGLLSVPGIGPEKADCLASRVAAAHPGARIVHRLDRDTSGPLLVTSQGFLVAPPQRYMAAAGR